MEEVKRRMESDGNQKIDEQFTAKELVALNTNENMKS